MVSEPLSCGLQLTVNDASSSAAPYRRPSSGDGARQCGIPALPLALSSDGRPSPANRAINSSGNFCPSLLCYHRHPSRPREPPKVVFQPRIGGSVQSQPIPALHAHYQTTDQTLRVQIRRDHRRPSFHAPTQKDLPVCQRASRAPTRHHGDPRASTRRTVFPRAGTHRQHLPRSPTRFGTISRGFRVPRAYWCVSCTRFLQPQDLRVHHTRQAFFPGHALTGAWDARALAASILWRVLYTRQALLITILLPRVS
jgi:hypothetical protein